VALFLDLRARGTGGGVAAEASLWDNGVLLPGERFASLVRGRDVLLATHGFNVNRECGTRSLSEWAQLLQMPPSILFVGVLWPGDSAFLPALDYPFEGSEAIQAGRRLARFLNTHGGSAGSFSFVSHSLGARMVLEAIAGLAVKARHLTLMAGAIEDDCLAKEYNAAAGNCRQIWTLASRKDRVLELMFPIGNLLAEIIMHGHPYFSAALGRNGPAGPIPVDQRGGAWQIPDGWHFGHHDYLPSAPGVPFVPPSQIGPLPPAADAPAPGNVPGPWKPSWSAAAVSREET
jgi:hypothetical protein